MHDADPAVGTSMPLSVSTHEISAEAIATFYPGGNDPATMEYAKDE